MFVFLAALVLASGGEAVSTEPTPEPTISPPIAPPSPGLGLVIGGHLGYQNPRGNFYRNGLKPGLAGMVTIGIRPIPHFSIETSLYSGTGRFEPTNDPISITVTGTADARFFLLGNGAAVPILGRIEPNVLIGYSTDAKAVLTSPPSDEYFTSYEYYGYSTNIGCGARVPRGRAWASLDLRYMFIRYTEAKIGDRFYDTYYDGDIPRHVHGDLVSLLLGAGVQF